MAKKPERKSPQMLAKRIDVQDEVSKTPVAAEPAKATALLAQSSDPIRRDEEQVEMFADAQAKPEAHESPIEQPVAPVIQDTGRPLTADTKKSIFCLGTDSGLHELFLEKSALLDLNLTSFLFLSCIGLLQEDESKMIELEILLSGHQGSGKTTQRNHRHGELFNAEILAPLADRFDGNRSRAVKAAGIWMCSMPLDQAMPVIQKAKEHAIKRRYNL